MALKIITILIATLLASPALGQDAARRLTASPGADFHPSISPDGQWLVFDTSRDGRNQVYVARRDGDEPRRLTDPASVNDHPRWLADGRITFESERYGAEDVFIMDVTGAGERRLTTRARGEMNGAAFPSPDGRWIAFLGQRSGELDVYVMTPDGEDQRRLTQDAGSEFVPSWSPGGDRIAVMAKRNDRWGIHVIDMEGRQTRLTDLRFNSEEPAWSPDGRWIAFRSDRGGDHDLYLMAPDGSGVRRLAGTPAPDGELAWSPDSRRLAFISGSEDAAELYVVEIADGRITRLTNNGFRETVPVWSPDGRELLFVSNRDGDLEIYALDVTP